MGGTSRVSIAGEHLSHQRNSSDASKVTTWSKIYGFRGLARRMKNLMMKTSKASANIPEPLRPTPPPAVNVFMSEDGPPVLSFSSTKPKVNSPPTHVPTVLRPRVPAAQSPWPRRTSSLATTLASVSPPPDSTPLQIDLPTNLADTLFVPPPPPTLAKRPTWWQKKVESRQLAAGKLTLKSDVSSWRSTRHLPSGNNDLSNYSQRPPSRSCPSVPRGFTPEPALPTVESVLGKRRYSSSSDSTNSLQKSPVELCTVTVSRSSSVTTIPFPELDTTADQTQTFDAILSGQELQPAADQVVKHTSTETTVTTLTIPRRPVPTPSTNAIGRKLSQLTLMSPNVPFPTFAPGHTLALPPTATIDMVPPQVWKIAASAIAPTPTILRPRFARNHNALTLNQQGPTPELHIVDIQGTSRKAQDTDYASVMGYNMAWEMHFDHVLQPNDYRFSWLVSRSDSTRSSTTLKSSRSDQPSLGYLSAMPDWATELTQVAEQIIEETASKPLTAEELAQLPPPPKRTEPTTTSPPPTEQATSPFGYFDYDNYPLLSSLETNPRPSTLRGPLPPGHTSHNGSAPVIARPKPGGYGWFSNPQVDAATEQYHENRQKRMQKRKKDLAAWLGESEETVNAVAREGATVTVSSTAKKSTLLSLIDFADEPQRTTPPGSSHGDLLHW